MLYFEVREFLKSFLLDHTQSLVPPHPLPFQLPFGCYQRYSLKLCFSFSLKFSSASPLWSWRLYSLSWHAKSPWWPDPATSPGFFPRSWNDGWNVLLWAPVYQQCRVISHFHVLTYYTWMPFSFLPASWFLMHCSKSYSRITFSNLFLHTPFSHDHFPSLAKLITHPSMLFLCLRHLVLKSQTYTHVARLWIPDMPLTSASVSDYIKCQQQ